MIRSVTCVAVGMAAEAIAVAPPDVAAVAAEVSDHRAITSPDPAGPDQILISHSSSTAFF